MCKPTYSISKLEAAINGPQISPKVLRQKDTVPGNLTLPGITVSDITRRIFHNMRWAWSMREDDVIPAYIDGPMLMGLQLDDTIPLSNISALLDAENLTRIARRFFRSVTAQYARDALMVEESSHITGKVFTPLSAFPQLRKPSSSAEASLPQVKPN